MPEWTLLVSGRQIPRRSHDGTHPHHLGRRRWPRINGDKERLYDLSGGATRLVNIEAAVESFKQAGLPERIAELLTLAQHQCVAEVKSGAWRGDDALPPIELELHPCRQCFILDIA